MVAGVCPRPRIRRRPRRRPGRAGAGPIQEDRRGVKASDPAAAGSQGGWPVPHARRPDPARSCPAADPATARPFHFRSAPRSEVDKGFSTLIVPVQEHFLLLARRSGANPDEKPGLKQWRPMQAPERSAAARAARRGGLRGTMWTCTCAERSGKFTAPIAADGRERIGGEAQDALAPGRINGETRGALPLLAAPGICTRSPDADHPVSRLLRTGHGPTLGGWIRYLAEEACLACRLGTT